MNIDLVYKGNNFKFDLRKDVTIKYIKDLSSKLINRDSSNFELCYKENFFSDFEETMLLKDLVKNDKNITIKIVSKAKDNFNINNKLKKLKVKETKNFNNNIKTQNSKILLNSSELFPIDSKNKLLYQNLSITQNKKGKKNYEYISKNKIFEDVYNMKENEITNLIKNLSQKIKEYDNILYIKSKNNSKNNNNELSLYEKNILNFQDNQINFLKNLISYFDFKEINFISGMIPLSEFYKALNKYNNNDKNIINCYNNEYNQDNKLNNKIASCSKEKEKKNLSVNDKNSFDENKLPLLTDNKSRNKRNDLFQKMAMSEGNYGNKNYFTEEIIKNKILREKSKKINKNNLNRASDNIILEINNDEDINSKKEENILNNDENNNKDIKDYLTKLYNEDNIDKVEYKDDSDKIENNNNKNENLYKGFSLNNTNNNTSTSQNTTKQEKILIKTLINDRKNDSRQSLNFINKSETIFSYERLKSMNNIYNKSDNKILSLYDENEQNKINNMNNTSESSDSNSSGKGISKYNETSSINSGINKINNMTRNEENKIGFWNTKRNKKLKTKERKLGYNVYDFII